MPSLTGRHAPELLKSLGETGTKEIIKWLVDDDGDDKRHHFLATTWKPFFLKQKERRDRKSESSQSDDHDLAHRIYFFAVDGAGFRDGESLLDLSQPHVRIPINTLLDCIRPTEKNSKQSFLKLFSRTSLGKSHSIH